MSKRDWSILFLPKILKIILFFRLILRYFNYLADRTSCLSASLEFHPISAFRRLGNLGQNRLGGAECFMGRLFPRPTLFIFFQATLTLSILGCGYQSSLEKTPPSYVIKDTEESKEHTATAQISRLSVPVFVNKTFEPLIENTLTRRFRQQILRDGHLKLVASEENSDMTLEGQLNSFSQIPLSFDTNNSALEYRISLVIQISLKDAKTKKVLWQKSGITGNSDYYVNADSNLNRAALDRAIDEASTVVAEDVISEILDLYR